MSTVRIQIVEDEGIVALDIQRSLRSLGYEVPVIVNNGVDALAKARETGPDLILMDIQIRGSMDGIEAAHEIWNTLGIPIVFLTAYADQTTLDRAKESEPFGYVLKPFEESELHTAIEMALSKWRSTSKMRRDYDRMIDSVKEYAICHWDLEGRVSTWNLGAERMKGYAAAEIIGKHASIFHTDPTDLAMRHIQSMMDQSVREGGYEEEGWRVSKSGVKFWALVTLTPLLDEKGRIHGFSEVTRDITEKKEAREALRRSTDLIQSILDFSPAIVYLKDLSGKFLFANLSCEKVFGCPRKDIVGKMDSDFFAEELCLRYADNDKKVVETRGPLEAEEWGQVNGESVCFWSVKFPLIDGNGVPYAVCGISTDITERKKMETQRTALLEQLQDAIRVRDDFISVASHELRTPITSMKLQGQMLGRTLRSDDSGKLCLDRLIRSCELLDEQLNRLNRLVEDMLDITRIGSGKMSLERSVCNLTSLAREVVKRNLSHFQSARMEVIFESNEEVIGSFDPLRMEQVISNLLSNAIKYAPGAPVKVRVQKKNDSVILCVKDHGMGIPKTSQLRIFEKYERAVESINVSGLGLGLYIVNSLVGLHGGKISVESDEGMGAEFCITLPCPPVYSEYPG